MENVNTVTFYFGPKTKSHDMYRTITEHSVLISPTDEEFINMFALFDIEGTVDET